jgi:hypothetical protein
MCYLALLAGYFNSAFVGIMAAQAPFPSSKEPSATNITSVVVDCGLINCATLFFLWNLVPMVFLNIILQGVELSGRVLTVNLVSAKVLCSVIFDMMK